jgi:hypothetical protein
MTPLPCQAVTVFCASSSVVESHRSSPKWYK